MCVSGYVSWYVRVCKLACLLNRLCVSMWLLCHVVIELCGCVLVSMCVCAFAQLCTCWCICVFVFMWLFMCLCILLIVCLCLLVWLVDSLFVYDGCCIRCHVFRVFV